jgi:hypothetical protein
MSRNGYANVQELTPSEAQALTGGDFFPGCFGTGCDFAVRVAMAVAEALANPPVASYAYGKCGM